MFSDFFSIRLIKSEFKAALLLKLTVLLGKKWLLFIVKLGDCSLLIAL